MTSEPNDLLPAGEAEIIRGLDSALEAAAGEQTASQKAPPAGADPAKKGRKSTRAKTVKGEPSQSGDATAFDPREDGVYKYFDTIDSKTGEPRRTSRRISSPIRVIAWTRSPDGNNWGKQIEVLNPDGKWNSWIMPMEMTAGEGIEILANLLSRGVTIEGIGTAKRLNKGALIDFILQANPIVKARCVTQPGWYHDSYVTFEGAITRPAADRESYILQSSGAAQHNFRKAGTLAGWQENVAAVAIGNSRLAFGISCAFAAALINPTRSEGGGFHFRGKSSSGKSTILKAAGSAWGGADDVAGFTISWNATINGIEGVAALHRDCILCLDEIGVADGQSAGAISYLLGNGRGRSRADRNGDARPVAELRTLVLSSGENSLADKIAESGPRQRVAAGQDIRLAEIPSEAHPEFGILDTLHGHPSSAALIGSLNIAVRQHFGHAAPAFVAGVVGAFDSVAAKAVELRRAFVKKFSPSNAPGQVTRVAERFGLVAAAGEIAAELAIVPWPPGEATGAAARCFNDWLTARGGPVVAEDMAILTAAQNFFEAHGNSRFQPLGELVVRDSFGNPRNETIYNQAGWRRISKHGEGYDFLVTPAGWRTIFSGHDIIHAARFMREIGILNTSSAGKLQINERIPGVPIPVKVYSVKSDIIGYS